MGKIDRFLKHFGQNRCKKVPSVLFYIDGIFPQKFRFATEIPRTKHCDTSNNFIPDKTLKNTYEKIGQKFPFLQSCYFCLLFFLPPLIWQKKNSVKWEEPEVTRWEKWVFLSLCELLIFVFLMSHQECHYCQSDLVVIEFTGRGPCTRSPRLSITTKSSWQ